MPFGIAWHGGGLVESCAACDGDKKIRRECSYCRGESRFCVHCSGVGLLSVLCPTCSGKGWRYRFNDGLRLW